MYEYKFVSASATWDKGRISLVNCERIIHDMASEGWRLVQVVVANTAAIPSEYAVIFERPRPSA